MDVLIVFLMVSALMGGGGGVVVPHFLKVFPDQPCNYFGEKMSCLVMRLYQNTASECAVLDPLENKVAVLSIST